MMDRNRWERLAAERAAPQQARFVKARVALARLDVQSLEAVTEAAIDLFDERCDSDEDHCLAGDDGCGLFVGGQTGGRWWGSDYEGEAEISGVPNYGEDQREILGAFATKYVVD